MKYIQLQAKAKPLVYWPVWIAIVNDNCLKKLFLPVAIPLDLLSCNLPVPLNKVAQYFNIITTMQY